MVGGGAKCFINTISSCLLVVPIVFESFMFGPCFALQFLLVSSFTIISHARIQMGTGARFPPTGKLAKGFRRDSCTDPLEKQLNPSGPIASRGRSVRNSVRYFKLMTLYRRKGP